MSVQIPQGPCVPAKAARRYLGGIMSRKSLGHHVTAALACMVLLPLVVARAELPNIPRDPPFNSVEVGHWDDYSGGAAVFGPDSSGLPD